jgi:hypothetical protein
MYHGRVLDLVERARHEVGGWLAAILVGAVSIILSAQTPAPHRECAGLTSLTLPDIKIGEAVAVLAETSGEIRAAHCRVTGVIGTEIRFSLLLPDTWNGKFIMGGGGGFVGNDRQSGENNRERRLCDRRHRHRAPGKDVRRRLGAR